MPKYFQYISYLQYLFHGLAVYYIATNALIRPDGYLSGVGFGVALLGLGFTIGSLSDTGKLSKKETAIFSSAQNFRKESRNFLIAVCAVFCASMFFISIRYANASLDPEIAKQYTNLGYGTLALAFGLLFELRQMYEKKRLFGN